MRTARIARRQMAVDTEGIEAGTVYHCFNRTAGMRYDRKFGDVEREFFVRLLKKLSRLYTVEVIAYTVMSNHFHLVLFAPAAEPSEAEARRRYNAYYKGKDALLEDDPRMAKVQARLRDFSQFMKDLQHIFTSWYSRGAQRQDGPGCASSSASEGRASTFRTRAVRRRGSLWADRYKSTILGDGMALWTALSDAPGVTATAG